MKTVIFGSRPPLVPHLEDWYREQFPLVEKAVKKTKLEITQVISGTAYGYDTLGERWAAKHSIKVERFPADWDRYGRGAGMVRNAQMAKAAEAGIGFWDGKSFGTANMIKALRGRGIPVHVFITGGSGGKYRYDGEGQARGD